MRIPSAKTFAVTACAVALLGAVGCSSNNNDSAGGTGTTQNTDPMTTATSGAPDMSAQLVGSGCATYAKAVPDGPGSVSGMAQDPVATAASNNPLLKTLVAAVSGGTPVRPARLEIPTMRPRVARRNGSAAAVQYTAPM